MRKPSLRKAAKPLGKSGELAHMSSRSWKPQKPFYLAHMSSRSGKPHKPFPPGPTSYVRSKTVTTTIPKPNLASRKPFSPQ